MDAGRLEDLPGRAAGDHTGTGSRGLEHHPRRVVLAHHLVRDGGAGERDREQVLLGLFHALLDRGRDFLRLAVAETDVAVPVADHHERGEREPPAALDDLRDSVDGDDSLVELTFGHEFLSELQSGCARTVGDGGNTAVILESTAIEDHRGDPRGLHALADELADLRSPRRPWPSRRCARRTPSSDALATVRPAMSSIACT